MWNDSSYRNASAGGRVSFSVREGGRVGFSVREGVGLHSERGGWCCIADAEAVRYTESQVELTGCVSLIWQSMRTEFLDRNQMDRHWRYGERCFPVSGHT